jgi:hypothetical protein
VDASPNSSTEFFIFVRRFFGDSNFFSGVTNYKFMRQDQLPGGFTDLVTTYLNGDGTMIVVNEGSNSAGPGADGKYFDPGFPPLQSWNIEEYQFSQGTLDVKDASYIFWLNGVVQANWTFIGRTSTYPGIWQVFDVQNFWSGAAPPSGAFVYLDDFYFDTTWARVMVGDQPTFDRSTHREIQIPTAWSDTSITVTLNQGTLNDLKNGYLYVIDANGQVNANGFRLCTICPAPPTNLRAN